MIAGTKLGPYEVLGKLGEGGMGEVYRARDQRLGRVVAIKVLPSHLALDRTALARFEREARAVAALSHPNILSIFDVGEDNGIVFAVTELLEGETLRDRLRAGPLPLRKALDYAAQIAQGLAAAHDKGIVHRDLKPENVFLSPDGRAKLLDFGLAKPAPDPAAADESTLVIATDPGMVAGTPPYMAPEQVRAQPVTPQTDIFALGSLLFEMLSGRRAFEGQGAVETMTAVLREEPPDLATLVPGLPPAVEALVRHCLEKQPAERFQSARDVAFQLQLAAGTPTPSHPSRSAVPLQREPGLTRRVTVGAALLLAVVVLFGAGWLFGRDPAATAHFVRASYTPKVIFRAAFTPEEDAMIYSAATEGNRPQLFQIGREYPSARPVGVPPGTHLLAVSPSGELALLVNARIVTAEILRGTLARMPLGASAPRPVLEDVRDADWVAGSSEPAIVRARGEKDALEFPPGHVVYQSDGYLSDLHVSPDGQRFAMFEHPMKWEVAASLIVVGRDGRRTVLAGEYPFAHGIAWRPDGSEVVFSASVEGAGDTSILGASMTARTRVLLDTPGSLTVHDVSGAGRWLVSRDERRVGLRVLAAGDTAERELSWLDRSEVAALSGDGRQVLFTESAPPAGPHGSVCLRRTDGSPVVTLGSGVAQDLSPDGAFALALSRTPPQLLIYPTGVGEKRALPRGAVESYRWAGWFPDGREILSCGTERGRAARCYVQDVNGSAPRAVTPDGEWGIVAPDGRRILVWRPEAPLAIYRVDGGAPEKIPGIADEDEPVGWTADGRGVLVYRPRQVPGQVDRIDLATGRREVLRQFSPPDRVGVLSLDPVLMTRDGSSYAYTYTRVLSTLFTVDGMK